MTCASNTNSADIEVIDLADFEQALEIYDFLMILASSLLSCHLLFVLLFPPIAGAVIGSISGVPWEIEVYLLGISLLAFFFYALPLSRMNRLFLPANTIYGFGCLLTGLGGSNLLGYFMASTPLFPTNPKVLQIFFDVASLVVGSWIIADGIRLSLFRKDVRNFLAIDRKSLYSWFISATQCLGIHPLCHYLQRSSQRAVSVTLFLSSSAAMGLSIFLVLYWMTNHDYQSSMALCVAQLAFNSSCVLSVNLPLSPILFALAIGLRRGARGVTRLSLEDLVKVDTRLPVLFLRSFRDDQVKLKRPRRAVLRWIVSLGEPAPTLDHVLIEEGSRSGPVVAIGMPGSPPPFGAARTYPSDSEWRDVIASIAREARIVVMTIDDTVGVKWELNHIRHAGHVHKTLYFLPPAYVTNWKAEQMAVRRVLGRHLGSSTSEGSKAAKKLMLMELQTDGGKGLSREVLAATIDKLRDPCIGWYWHSDKRLVLLTTKHPSKNSYVCGMRIALDRASQETDS